MFLHHIITPDSPFYSADSADGCGFDGVLQIFVAVSGLNSDSFEWTVGHANWPVASIVRDGVFRAMQTGQTAQFRGERFDSKQFNEYTILPPEHRL
eukprot:gene15576-18227_t